MRSGILELQGSYYDSPKPVGALEGIEELTDYIFNSKIGCVY